MYRNLGEMAWFRNIAANCNEVMHV
jgi:hypothetical protein